MRALLPLLLLCAAPVQAAQDPRPTPLVADVEPEALALWQRTCRSTFLRDPDTAKPVTALDLSLDVRTRGKAGSNDLHPRLLWLAPSFLRFEISRGRESARGPDGYWLRDGEEVVRLEGREGGEDRRQIEELLVIVHNVVALTQPATLEIHGLRKLARAPAAIRRTRALASGDFEERLEWIQLDTPGLQLSTSPVGTRRVELGIERATGLPILALVSDSAAGAPPVLIHLDGHRPLDDLRVPASILVYAFERRFDDWVLDGNASHELYVRGGTLRADLGPADFRQP